MPSIEKIANDPFSTLEERDEARRQLAESDAADQQTEDGLLTRYFAHKIETDEYCRLSESILALINAFTHWRIGVLDKMDGHAETLVKFYARTLAHKARAREAIQKWLSLAETYRDRVPELLEGINRKTAVIRKQNPGLILQDPLPDYSKIIERTIRRASKFLSECPDVS
jgi:hypothetical protein